MASLVISALISVAFCYAAWEMIGFNPSSRLMPALALVPGIPLVFWLLFRAIQNFSLERDEAFNEPFILVVLLAYAIGIWAIGFSLPTVMLIGWMLFLRAGMRLLPGLVYGVIVFAIVWLLFDLLRGDAPTGFFTGMR